MGTNKYQVFQLNNIYDTLQFKKIYLQKERKLTCHTLLILTLRKKKAKRNTFLSLFHFLHVSHRQLFPLSSRLLNFSLFLTFPLSFSLSHVQTLHLLLKFFSFSLSFSLSPIQTLHLLFRFLIFLSLSQAIETPWPPHNFHLHLNVFL